MYCFCAGRGYLYWHSRYKNKVTDKMFMCSNMWLVRKKNKELTLDKSFHCLSLYHLLRTQSNIINEHKNTICLSVCLSLLYKCTHASICCGVCKSMEQHVISLTANDRSPRPCYVALVWDQLLTGAFKLIWSTGRSSSFHLSSHRLGWFKRTSVY